MKRALIVTALAGFVRSFLMEDIATLQSMGYEVHCAANAHHAGAGNVVEFLETHDVVFHQVDFSSNKPLSGRTVKAYFQLRRLVYGTRFDFVHCHTPIAGALCRVACRGMRRKRGMKVAYTTHGFYFHAWSSKKTWLVFRTIENLMSQYTDVMITINHEDYANARKMQCKDVRYIPGVGVDLRRFHDATVDRQDYRAKLGLSDEDFVVLAVGELSKRKNQKIIVEALAQCDIPHAVFLICGNAITGSEVRNGLEAEARAAHVDLRFLGLRKDIPQIDKCADVGVLPSTREGLGLAGIEMLAAGLPVIGSNVHGIPDYIKDGVNGFLCDPYDAASFAKALTEAALPKVRERLRANCWQSVQAFDIAESRKAMRKIYADVLAPESGTR